MKRLLAVLTGAACLVGTAAVAAIYSTEATITQQEDKSRYRVEVRVSRLIEQNGKLTEQLIARPRIDSAPGVPASLYQGLQPSQPNYENQENVTLEVSWPEAGESGFAVCMVTVKRGDKVVALSKVKVQVDSQSTLTAEQAGTLARQLANAQAQTLYGVQPFGDGAPARFVEGQWVWSDRRGYGHADVEATVILAADGSARSVEVLLLDSQRSGWGPLFRMQP